MDLIDILGYEFVRNALMVAVLASLLCGLVGTFVVIKRLVFISGGVSHAAFGGLGICHFFGLPPLVGAGAAAVLAALLVSRTDRGSGRSRDALIGILWAVGMAVGVVFIARTPGYAPNLTTYLFGDILAVSRTLVIATGVLVATVLACVALLFKELVAVSFDEEFARAQGLPVRRLLMLLMVLIALSVVLLIQAVGVILSIALLTIPPTISLSTSQTFRGVMVQATLLGLVMTVGGLAMSFAWSLPSGPTIVLVGFVMLLVSSARKWLATRRAVRAAAVLLAVLGPATSVSAQQETGAARRVTESIGHLEFLGEAVVPPIPDDPVPLGGLSGITYDQQSDRYYVISDDRAQHGPARIYTLEIGISRDRPGSASVRTIGYTELQLPDGAAFGQAAIDPEGIALTADGTLIVTSEGSAASAVPPFVREFSLDGRQLAEFPLSERYTPRRDGQSGVRDNLALESAALTPDGRWFFTGTENALAQDGGVSTLRSASPSRILRFDTTTRGLVGEYLYMADRVAEPPSDGSFTASGLVEILALDVDRLITMERSFSRGAGNQIRLYEVNLGAATDIRNLDSLSRHGLEGVVAADKRLLLDVHSLGIEPDNLEGMAFGPRLADGARTLLLLADDNFNLRQRSQLLAFALHDRTLTIEEIQGDAHVSPQVGDWVRRVEGVVTAVDSDPRGGGFWMQQTMVTDTASPARSSGIRVDDPKTTVAVGDVVSVDGAVNERAFGNDLGVTSLRAGQVRVLAAGSPLPEPVVVGGTGRRPPAEIVDDDRMTRMDPCCDGIDFYESLEGMRVRVDDAVVVGATSRYGEIAVVTDGAERASVRTRRGGVVIRPGDANPERLILSGQLTPDPPPASVGDRFVAPVVGVLDYSFGNFKLLVEGWPRVEPRAATRPEPPLRGTDSALSVASYNVLNLDPGDGAEAFRRLAATVVEGLGSPDLLGLQEIQDDSGATDDGVTSADGTLALLIDAIAAAGGPRYEYRQIDPENNVDGGEPGGNIRVVWMFRPERVRWMDRGDAGPRSEVEVRSSETGVELSLSPGRIGSQHPAFAGDAEKGWEGGRKCLAGEVTFRGQTLFLVNCHLKSKRGDDGLFGARQPPAFRSEEQRSAQARKIRALVERILVMDPEAAIVVVGDMNEHEFRAPMRVLTGTSMENLTERLPLEDRYSFNYQGNSQLLDHILVSRSLAARVHGIRIAHLNADSPHGTRASDHDPVLVWLDFD